MNTAWTLSDVPPPSSFAGAWFVRAEALAERPAAVLAPALLEPIWRPIAALTPRLLPPARQWLRLTDDGEPKLLAPYWGPGAFLYSPPEWDLWVRAESLLALKCEGTPQRFGAWVRVRGPKLACLECGGGALAVTRDEAEFIAYESLTACLLPPGLSHPPKVRDGFVELAEWDVAVVATRNIESLSGALSNQLRSRDQP